MQSVYTRISLNNAVLPVTFQVRKHFGEKGARRQVAVARVLGPNRDSYDRIVVEPSDKGGFVAYPESNPKKAVQHKKPALAFATAAEKFWA